MHFAESTRTYDWNPLLLIGVRREHYGSFVYITYAVIIFIHFVTQEVNVSFEHTIHMCRPTMLKDPLWVETRIVVKQKSERLSAH